MKLRNLMYATMIACAFASCSKDDVTTPGGKGTDAGLGDAKMSVKIALADPSTKAVGDPNAMGEEANISNVQIAIYNGAAKIAEAAPEDIKDNTAKFTGLPANTTLRCIVLVNMADVSMEEVNPTSLSKTLTVPTNGFEQGKLPMFAMTGDIVLKPNTETTETVSVIRNVARIQVSGITLNMAHADSKFKSGNASFALTGISVNTAANSAKVAGSYDSETSYLYGYADFVAGAKSFSAYLKNFTPADNTISQDFDKSKSNESVAMPNLKENNNPVNYFYVFPNEGTLTVGSEDQDRVDNRTVLTIAGNFSLENGVTNGGTVAQEYVNEPVFYPVVIGLDGVKSAPVAKVERNKIYDIDLTIAGPGYKTPGPDPSGKDASFIVSVKVADWDPVVEQKPVIN